MPERDETPDVYDADEWDQADTDTDDDEATEMDER